jgi:hypothetical protein
MHGGGPATHVWSGAGPEAPPPELGGVPPVVPEPGETAPPALAQVAPTPTHGPKPDGTDPQPPDELCTVVDPPEDGVFTTGFGSGTAPLPHQG